MKLNQLSLKSLANMMKASFTDNPIGNRDLRSYLLDAYPRIDPTAGYDNRVELIQLDLGKEFAERILLMDTDQERLQAQCRDAKEKLKASQEKARELERKIAKLEGKAAYVTGRPPDTDIQKVKANAHNKYGALLKRFKTLNLENARLNLQLAEVSYLPINEDVLKVILDAYRSGHYNAGNGRIADMEKMPEEWWNENKDQYYK